MRDVDTLALEREGGVARDDEERRHLAQIGDDVLADAVAEIFLLDIAAHIGEGQHANRQLAGCILFVGLGLGRCATARTENTWTGRSMFFTVCSPMSSNTHRRLALDLIAHNARDRHAADRRQRLEARRDVDAFAVDVVALDDDFAQIDADAVADALGFGKIRSRPSAVASWIASAQLTAAIDARELDQRAVTHQLEQRPPWVVTCGSKIRLRLALSRSSVPGLVGLHQAAVADHVGGQDGGQFALHQRRNRLFIEGNTLARLSAAGQPLCGHTGRPCFAGLLPNFSDLCNPAQTRPDTVTRRGST